MARRNPMLFFPFIVIFLVFFIAIVSFSYFRPEEYEDQPLDVFDLFIYSSYYFRESKSLGDNSVALVFTADFDLLDTHKYFEFTVFSDRRKEIVKAPIQRITPHHKCKWIDFSSVFPVLPETQKIALNIGEKQVEIPLSAPSSKYFEVVTCIAPLYASEQWQMAILAAHVYKRFGSHMHLYARSLVSPLYGLMKEYERMGYLTLQPWHKISLSNVPKEDFEPNVNVEFRNQGSAQTDCLFQYKETASFISFVDLDDILIPRLHNNYFEEFEELFHSFPNVAYLVYNKENSHAIARDSGENFSLMEMISTINFEQKWETGKHVTRPKYANASWIHWPAKVPKGMKGRTVPSKVNAITHVKHFSTIPGKAGIIFSHPLYNPLKNQRMDPETLISAEDGNAMENDFQRMMNSSKMNDLMAKMPKKFFYANLISECYDKEFYKFFYSGQLGRLKCFGPERCTFPKSPGIPCFNAQAKYESHEGSVHNLHFALSSEFLEEDGCIR